MAKALPPAGCGSESSGSQNRVYRWLLAMMNYEREFSSYTRTLPCQSAPPRVTSGSTTAPGNSEA